MGSVKSPRASKPSADDSQGVVPGAGTNALSVVPSSQVLLFFVFDGDITRCREAPLGHGLRLATGTTLPVPFFSAAAKLGNGSTRPERRPHHPWHESLRFLRSPPGTRRAAIQLL